MKYKLSICVITMNRAQQLKEALESCLACRLPAETEFVVIDNASSDRTEQVVQEVLGHCGYDSFYEKLSENLGVGGGRNYACSKAHGRYVYMMDDDAVIEGGENGDFFLKALDILESNENIMTLTTQIYDTALERNRLQRRGPEIADGVSQCKMFCGGSHFLRMAFFENGPYLQNKYGYEEIPPSLRVMDAGKINAFAQDLLVIHKPVINKWDWSNQDNGRLLIKECAIPYAIRKKMYPAVFRPVLWLAVFVRTQKYLKAIPDWKVHFQNEIKKVYEDNQKLERIKVATVLKMARIFGLSIF